MIDFNTVNLILNPPKVNPVRKFSGVLNPIGIILRFNPATQQHGTISNGVNPSIKGWVFTQPLIDPKKSLPSLAGFSPSLSREQILISATSYSPTQLPMQYHRR